MPVSSKNERSVSVRSMIPFLVAVFVVAIAGTYLALQVFGGGNRSAGSQPPQVITVPVIITATPDPRYTPPVVTVIVTDDRPRVEVPTNIAGQTDGTPSDGQPAATLLLTGEPLELDLNAEAAGTATALPQNCIVHSVVEGDAPFFIAEQYGVDGFLLMQANGLTEETATGLQIGDTLIIPLPGCAVETLPSFLAPTAEEGEATATPTGSAGTGTPGNEETEEAGPTFTASPSPTITLAPTASNAQLVIVGIEKAGDVTAEGVRIRNTGNTVNATGWTLSDLDGNVYTFGELLIFSNTEVTIYTRAGQNTPIALFWGLDRAVWNTGDVVTLADAREQVQATQRIESAQALPSN
jgi:hypothetical protein